MKPTLAFLAVTAALCSQAHALEPLKSYDRFSADTVDPTRWTAGERTLAIHRGALQLVQRTYGSTASDTGLGFVNWNENLADPSAVTELQAKITVNALEVNACPSNPAVAQTRARIAGSFFNIGTPTPGSQVNDVIAQVKLTRYSNSADAPGVLRVQGIASLCTNATCDAATTLGNVVELGTVAIGTSVVVTMQWDQGGKTFFFGRDNGAASGSTAYALSDASPPSLPFKQVSTRLDIPACHSSPQVSGYVDASFDNVMVNASAAP
jgi:hypothetical protein